MINSQYIFILPLIASFLLSYSLMILWTKNLNYGHDLNTGIQKIHSAVAIRIGSIPILISLLITGLFLSLIPYTIIIVLLCLIPCFFFGLLEDLVGNISIKLRLCGIISSSILLILFTEPIVSHINFEFAKPFFSIYFFASLFTLLGYVAIANSWNFIDGLNGLSTGIFITIMLNFSYLFSFYNDYEYSNFCLFMAFLYTGFWIINITYGRIFLGDGGALSSGLIVGWLGVYLIFKNPNISPWGIFLTIIYPATELIYSVFRRLLNKRSPFMPDDLHMHTLLFHILENKLKKFSKLFINSLTGLLIVFFGTIPGIINSYYLGKFTYVFYYILIFVLIYTLTNIYLTRIKKQL